MKTIKGHLVQVEWKDHFSFRNHGWTKYSEVKQDIAPEICHSVCVVITDGKETITLAQNWHPMDQETNVADFMTIIKACIIKVKILKQKVI